MKRRWNSRFLVCALTIMIIVGGAASARAQVSLGYQIRTTVGSIVRTTNATAGVPAQVDADGTLGPDLIVDAVPPAHIAVATLKTISLKVEIIFPFGNGFASLGYDTQNSVAPALWDVAGAVTADLAGITVDIRSVLPGRTMVVLGELYRLVAGRKVDPMLMNVALDPTPTILHIEGSRSAGRTVVDVNPNIPTTVTAVITGTIGPTTMTLLMLIRPLPTYLRVEMVDQASPKGPLVTFRSGADIGSIIAAGALTSSGRTLNFSGNLRNVTARLIEVEQDEAKHAVVRFPLRGSIESIEIGVSQNGAIDSRELSPGANFVRGIDRGAYKSVFGRLNNLGFAGTEVAEPDFRVFEAAWGDPVIVGLQQRAAAPFYVSAETGGVVLTGHIKDIPSKAKVAYHKSGRLKFDGSAPIGEIFMSALAPVGQTLIPGTRARNGRVVVRGIPNGLDLLVTVVDNNVTKVKSVALDGQGKSIAFIDVLLSSSDSPSGLSSAWQHGLVLVDTPSIWTVNGRIVGLRKASLSIAKPCIFGACIENVALSTSTQGGLPFRVEVTTQGKNGAEFITGTIRNLPSEIAAELRVIKADDAGAEAKTVNLDWRANQAATELLIDTSTPARVLTVRPLPSRFHLCFDKGGKSCTPGATRANQASFSFITGDPSASVGERTKIYFSQCDKAPCFGDDGKWIKVDNVSLERLSVAMDYESGEQVIELYLDTAGRDLFGNMWFENPTVGLDFRLPQPSTGRSFWASNRRVFIDVSFPGPTEAATPRGQINCPPGTSFNVSVADLFGWNLRDLICPH